MPMSTPLTASERISLLGTAISIKNEAWFNGGMGKFFNDGMRDFAKRLEAAAYSGQQPDLGIDGSFGRMYSMGQRRALELHRQRSLHASNEHPSSGLGPRPRLVLGPEPAEA